MLNERIRALRLAKGLTLQQVGDVFGISRGSVSNWEAGHAQPDPRKIERLAQLFGTSVQYLLSGVELPALLGFESSFAGVPFVPFEQLNLTHELIETLCQQSKKFLPTPFGTASIRAFCTNFPSSNEPISGKLIPAGAVVFIDPELTLKNQSVFLGRNDEMKADFFVAEILNTARKFHSLTNLTPQTQTDRSLEIIGIATGYALFSSLNTQKI